MSKARGPYRVDPLGYKKANEALDKMAENAKELGLDYELQDKDPDLIEQPAQQEPVACANGCRGFAKYPAQRTWVGLSDEEISARAANFYNPEMYKRAVLWAQEKLKERNQ